jgi:hypothetical protein
MQSLEREPMVDDMPRTELVLALYMAKQLIHGNQDFVSSSHVKERCVQPMGFLEQVGLAFCCTPYSCAHSLAAGWVTGCTSASRLDTSWYQQHGTDPPLRSNSLWHLIGD